MKRVLIVDDNATVISLTATLLKLSGYNTVCADSAISALNVLEQDDNFDLILSDIFMARMNGITLMQHIRERYPYIPVLLSSADSQPETIRKVNTSGANGFLPRPFTKTELLRAIDGCINQTPSH